jgi:uncharacterized membrane protein
MIEWDFKLAGIYIPIFLIPVGVICSLCVFNMQRRKVYSRIWILVPFALITSIVFLKSAAGIVVDAIAVV